VWRRIGGRWQPLRETAGGAAVTASPPLSGDGRRPLPDGVSLAAAAMDLKAAVGGISLTAPPPSGACRRRRLVPGSRPTASEGQRASGRAAAAAVVVAGNSDSGSLGANSSLRVKSGCGAGRGRPCVCIIWLSYDDLDPAVVS
jgi:hypothetical protein